MTEIHALASVGPMIETTVTLPWTGLTISVTRPATIDDLLDRSEHDPEQNLPYFAEIWPSGIALADLLIEQPGFVANRRVLEVGSGLGITAVAAARSGAHLTISDYFGESLLLAAFNLDANSAQAESAAQINWREQETIERLLENGPFPVVIAADILYESRDVDPLLAFFDQVIAPAGTLILAEPGRPVATRFLDRATTIGWDTGEIARHDGPWPDPKDKGVSVGIHSLRRARSDR